MICQISHCSVSAGCSGSPICSGAHGRGVRGVSLTDRRLEWWFMNRCSGRSGSYDSAFVTGRLSKKFAHTVAVLRFL